MEIDNLKIIIEKKGTEVDKKNWNNWIDVLKKTFKKQIKYCKKYIDLDKKVLENKQKIQTDYLDVVDTSFLEDYPEYWKIMDYVNIQKNIVYNNYYNNEIERRKYKYAIMKKVYEDIIQRFGADEASIDNYFERLKINA